jgi:hypothetical protein
MAEPSLERSKSHAVARREIFADSSILPVAGSLGVARKKADASADVFSLFD